MNNKTQNRRRRGRGIRSNPPCPRSRGNRGRRSCRGFCYSACLLGLLLILLVTGCSTVVRHEYYPNGTVKLEFKKTGFTGFSSGDGKVINMPLANPSVIGK